LNSFLKSFKHLSDNNTSSPSEAGSVNGLSDGAITLRKVLIRAFLAISRTHARFKRIRKVANNATPSKNKNLEKETDPAVVKPGLWSIFTKYQDIDDNGFCDNTRISGNWELIIRDFDSECKLTQKSFSGFHYSQSPPEHPKFNHIEVKISRDESTGTFVFICNKRTYSCDLNLLKKDGNTFVYRLTGNGAEYKDKDTDKSLHLSLSDWLDSDAELKLTLDKGILFFELDNKKFTIKALNNLKAAAARMKKATQKDLSRGLHCL